jgi:hypothetical protein
MVEKIIECLPSGDLKKKIRETNFVFSEKELLQIILDYANPMDLRHDMLLKFSEISSPEISALAREFIRYDNVAFDAFKNNNGAVYKLKIREDPYSAEYEYFCQTYDAALALIDKYGEKYKFEENEDTIYEIIKERLFCENDTFFDDEIFSGCILGPGKTLVDVWSHEVDTGECTVDNACSDCDQICHHNCAEVKYPNFAENYSLIKYIDQGVDRRGQERFAVNVELPSRDNTKLETLFAMNLDSPYFGESKMCTEFFEAYTEIPLPIASLVSLEELTDEEKSMYSYIVEHLKNDPYFTKKHQ